MYVLGVEFVGSGAKATVNFLNYMLSNDLLRAPRSVPDGGAESS
jgi:hypothetical protein